MRTPWVLALAGVVILLVGGAVVFVFERNIPPKTFDSANTVVTSEIVLKINKYGYFTEDGLLIPNLLKVKRGKHIKFILKYDENPKEAAENPEMSNHQIAISNAQTGFWAESGPLSPQNVQSSIEFDAGAAGAKDYLVYCAISCSAMHKLVNLHIEVVD